MNDAGSDEDLGARLREGLGTTSVGPGDDRIEHVHANRSLVEVFKNTPFAVTHLAPLNAEVSLYRLRSL